MACPRWSTSWCPQHRAPAGRETQNRRTLGLGIDELTAIVMGQRRPFDMGTRGAAYVLDAADVSPASMLARILHLVRDFLIGWVRERRNGATPSGTAGAAISRATGCGMRSRSSERPSSCSSSTRPRVHPFAEAPPVDSLPGAGTPVPASRVGGIRSPANQVINLTSPAASPDGRRTHLRRDT